MSRRGNWSRRDFVKLLASGSGLLLLRCVPTPGRAGPGNKYNWNKHFWGYAVDTTRCIGCCACMRACRAENDVPKGTFRTWVERYRISAKGKVNVDVAAKDDFIFDEIKGDVAKAFFVPKLCNHCTKSVCSQVCPVGASYLTRDGVVLVDHKQCVGCGYCVQACPYGTRYIHPKTHTADKCTLCYHRITRTPTQLPACVLACPKEARIFGDLKDPSSKLSTILKQRRYRLLRPELGTHPKCYYLGLDLEVI
jgi:Fe-S-cluster-containing dehydrogenase component